MANSYVDEDGVVAVHYAGSLRLRYQPVDQAGVRVDTTGWSLWFEIPALGIREALVADADDVTGMGQVVVLENAQVALLSKTPKDFFIRDETDIADDEPIILMEGRVRGYGPKSVA